MASTSQVPLSRLAALAPTSALPSRPASVSVTRHEQRDVTVLGGLRLRYVDVRPPEPDDGSPPLVLLHGLASRLEEYENLVEVLRPRRRVIVMDLPGNGYSDKPARAYSLQLLEDAVLGLLDQLDPLDRSGDRTFDLGGGSLGGNLTLRLAHREPGRFRRLVSWAPGGAWEPKPVLAWLQGVLKGAAAFWPTVWVQSRFWYHPSWPPRARALAEAFAHYREVHGPGFVSMYFDLAREQLATSLFPIAPQIPHRTMMMWGDQDHALGMGRGVKRLAKLLPDARLSVFAGVRHAVANEVPEELGRRIEAFLDEP
jgi:pimeloyl-ACP methyl ester carboxylesterase